MGNVYNLKENWKETEKSEEVIYEANYIGLLYLTWI